EQLDAVRLSAQHPLAHVGHAQLESHERVPVAERRRWRKRRAVTLDEAVVSLPERGERAEEPRVAEERRILASLCCDERGGSGARTCLDRLECMSLRSREPVARRRQLLEQAAQCGG